jgi:hypothetical protein
METVNYSEMSVNLYGTTRRHTAEYIGLDNWNDHEFLVGRHEENILPWKLVVDGRIILKWILEE